MVLKNISESKKKKKIPIISLHRKVHDYKTHFHDKLFSSLKSISQSLARYFLMVVAVM